MNHANHADTPPRVSVIIPSRDGHRDGFVPRLLESVARQRFTDYEIQLVTGVFPQGKSINQGAEAARGAILLILDDDSCLADETVFGRLVDVLDNDDTVGMVGASIVLHPDASAFQVRAARQFPRFNMPVVSVITDSDYACHGCCAIPARVFNKIGGEREDIVRGLDPDLRVRLRAAGYRVVLAPQARIYHPMPEGWRALVRIFFRNGTGSAYAQKFQPNSVYETHEQIDATSFRPRTHLFYRIARFPLRLAKALLTGRFERFAAYGAYACGYVWAMLTLKQEH